MIQKNAKKKPKQDNDKSFVPFRRLLLDASPPKSLQYMNWTRVAGEWSIEFGYADMVELKKQVDNAQAGKQPEEVDLIITERFVFGIEAARRIVDSINQMGADLDSIGKKKAEAEKP